MIVLVGKSRQLMTGDEVEDSARREGPTSCNLNSSGDGLQFKFGYELPSINRSVKVNSIIVFPPKQICQHQVDTIPTCRHFEVRIHQAY